MHPCLNVDEILRLVAYQLIELEAKATAVSLASCCRSFGDPVLDALWETQYRPTPLLKCLPQEVWREEDGSFSLRRIPTKVEWANLQKYARRIRMFRAFPSKDPLTSENLLALQFRAANEPFLPRLKMFECDGPTKAFIPFMPFFLSPKTTHIKITFGSDSSPMMDASVIGRLSTLCPELEFIMLKDMERDPVITDAVSEMLLACNRETLKYFFVDSPLTEEARGALFQFPKLSELWLVIHENARLPPVSFPNLTMIDVEFGDSPDCLQWFRGVTLEKLEGAYIRSESDRIGDFIEGFERSALSISAQNTLKLFMICTTRSWIPNYSSLLSLKQLSTFDIQFSCDDGCSSTVDDDIIAILAQEMPKLETLELGGEPCATPSGITVNGLVTLASRCPHLSRLGVHFQAGSLVSVATSASTTPPDDPPREGCALTALIVGNTPIPPGSAMTVTFALLQIFPRIINIEYTSQEWKAVAEHIKSFRQIGTSVRRIGARLEVRHSSEDSWSDETRSRKGP